MERIKWIDGVRGLFCIWIVLYHYTCRYSQIYENAQFAISFENGAAAGVLAFFLISGYLCMSSSERFDSQGWGVWMLNKFKRLYVPLLVASIVIFCIDNFLVTLREQVSFSILLKSLFLIPYYSPYVDSAHWYVFSLIRYYFVFSLIFAMKVQHEKVCWTIIVLVFVTNGAFNHFANFNPMSFVVPCWFDNRFVEGALMYFIAKKYNHYYLFLYLLNGLMICVTKGCVYTIPILVLFPLWFKYDKLCLPIKKILSSKLLLYIGTISYAWYLCHQNIGYAIIRILSTDYNIKIDISVLIAVVITAIIAVIVTYLCGKILKLSVNGK